MEEKQIGKGYLKLLQQHIDISSLYPLSQYNIL